jgi:hypothetical protein
MNRTLRIRYCNAEWMNVIHELQPDARMRAVQRQGRGFPRFDRKLSNRTVKASRDCQNKRNKPYNHRPFTGLYYTSDYS